MKSRRDRIREKIMARVVEEQAPDGLGLEKPCLLWQGPTSGNGRGGEYPRMCLDGATVAVHITNWVIEHGPIPPRKQLDHICRRRRCIEDSHLEMVTHKENQRRRDRARRFECEAIAV